jgi:hypothetical protein
VNKAERLGKPGFRQVGMSKINPMQRDILKIGLPNAEIREVVVAQVNLKVA